MVSVVALSIANVNRGEWRRVDVDEDVISSVAVFIECLNHWGVRHRGQRWFW